MKIKKIFFLLCIATIFGSPIFAAIFQVKVLFREYKTANEWYGAVRVTIINESPVEKNGSLDATGNEFSMHYDVNLKIGEKKIYDIPLFLNGNHSSITVKFGDERENIYVDRESGKSFENGVLEIKVPNKGTLFFNRSGVALDTECVLERIELEELPTNLYCLFHYQIIVLPIEMEASLSPEQFQLLKSYIGFGGKIIIIDDNAKIPARWKNISLNAWGSVFVVKKDDSIDFDKYISKKNILDPRNGFYKTQNYAFNVPLSSKGVYLIIVILFIVCIGPINYYLLKKRNKTFLIFFTSPIISLVFSALLIGVFFIKEGFYKSYEGISLTMINPQTNQALINIRNAVYSSNISGKMERPRNGVYFPLEDRNRNSQHHIEIEDKAYLSGGFSKARTVNNFGEIRLVECNSKVTMRYDGDRVFTKNGFGSKQKLVILDFKTKNVYESVNFVEPDKEILMQQFSMRGSDFSRVFKTLEKFEDILRPFFDNLTEGLVYVAFAETNEMVPFREKDGFKQGSNLHLILGVINQ